MTGTNTETLKEDILEIKQQLYDIQQTINRIAVHDERMKHIEVSQEALWKKYDAMRSELNEVLKFEATCPRETIQEKLRHLKMHINWLWTVQGSLVFLMLSVALKILQG